MSGLPSARALYRRWIRGYFLAAFLLLAAATLLGYGLGTLVSNEWLQQGASSSSLFPDEITFQYILWNNLVAITVMLLGAVSVGLLTAVALIVNGVVIGAVVQIALREASATTVAALIVPHGVIEIPAILLVAAIGFRFGHRTYRYVRGREAELLTVRELKEAAVLYVVAALMIVVAAWIEGNYTLRLAERLAG